MSAPPFKFPPAPADDDTTANSNTTTTLPLRALLNEGAATGHEPLQNKYATHPLVMFDNNRTADKNLVGAWSALMNLGRKGDAEKIRKIGNTTFGEKQFEGAISTAITHGSGDPPAEEDVAAAGFARVEVAPGLEDPSGDDRETAKKCLATAARAFGDLRQQGIAEKIDVVFKSAFGESIEEYWV